MFKILASIIISRLHGLLFKVVLAVMSLPKVNFKRVTRSGAGAADSARASPSPQSRSASLSPQSSSSEARPLGRAGSQARADWSD